MVDNKHMAPVVQLSTSDCNCMLYNVTRTLKSIIYDTLCRQASFRVIVIASAVIWLLYISRNPALYSALSR